jgi:hypothetical protein
VIRRGEERGRSRLREPRPCANIRWRQAEKLVGEIRATHPVHMCFSFKVGATPHKAAMRSMELMMSEVRPQVERALGPLGRQAAE